jgi:hypothetical protein
MSSTWLTNPTANRYKQTYTNNFLEISGNLIVNNSQYCDINQNVQLKNGAKLYFPDGTFISSASGIAGNIPLNIFFANVDISNNLNVQGNTVVKNITVSNLIFPDASVQTTAFTPENETITNLTISGSIVLPSASISNSALQSSVVLTTAIQTLTNKTISSTGITDSATAALTNLIVSGTCNIPTLTNTTLNGTTLNGTTLNSTTINNSGTATTNNQIVLNNLTVNGATVLNTLEWNTSGGIKVYVGTIPTYGFLYSPTQMVYYSSASPPTVGDFVLADATKHLVNITSVGSSGATVSSTNTTNQLITFNSAVGYVATPASTINGYALNTTTIQYFGTSTASANQGVISSAITTINKPYISTVNNTTHQITLAGACMTASTQLTITGIFDNNSNIINSWE